MSMIAFPFVPKRQAARLLLAAAILAALPVRGQCRSEWAVGYSNFQLRPASGAAQKLEGVFLGWRGDVGSRWSLEADLRRETGTDADRVQYEQVTFTAGPRLTQPWSPRLDAYVHALVGLGSLEASLGPLQDRKRTLLLAPGTGLAFHLGRGWSLLGQADAVSTRYAGMERWNLRGSLGLAWRGGGR